MRRLKSLSARAAAFFTKRRWEPAMREEIEGNLQLDIDDGIRAGLSPAEARRQALIRLGGIAASEENYRDRKSLPFLETLAQDVRFAVRSFARTPAFTLAAVLTLAIGLGLNGVVFSIVDAYILRPFPVRDPGNLHELRLNTKTGPSGFTQAEFDDLAARTAPLTETFAMSGTLARTDDERSLNMIFASANYFPMLEPRMTLGRGIRPDEANAGQMVAVLSHRAWTSRFGADPNIVGKTIRLEKRPLTVVGVTEPRFVGVDAIPQDAWVPLRVAPLFFQGIPEEFGPERGAMIRIYGRLAPQFTRQSAREALLAWGRAALRGRGAGFEVQSIEPISRAAPIALPPSLASRVGIFTSLNLLFWVVLAIACANVSNMLLARAMARQREIAVRLSLGASRRRIVRQMVTESLLLGGAAGLCAAALAHFAIRFAVDALLAGVPPAFSRFLQLVPMGVDWRVLLYLVAAGTLAVLVFGLFPALQSTRLDLVSGLRGDFGQSVRVGRSRSALAVFQVAVCLLLLILTGVLVNGASRLEAVDPRIRTSNVYAVSVFEKEKRLARILAGEPWVEQIAMAGQPPLIAGLGRAYVAPSGSSERHAAGYLFVTPEYFRILGIPLRKGRMFSEREANSESTEVTVISQKTADKFWPGQDPIGKTIRTEVDPRMQSLRLNKPRTAEVIGVVGDVITSSILEGLDPTCFYFPSHRDAPLNQGVLVASRLDEAATLRKLETLTREVAPGTVSLVVPLDQPIALQTYPFRAGSWFARIAGLLAIALMMAGMYAVTSYLVNQRTREMGVRIALGANRAGVARMVVWQSLRLAAIGLPIGALLAFAVVRAVAGRSSSFAADWRPFAVGVAIVLAATAAAAWIPARRAARVDPAVALRAE